MSDAPHGYGWWQASDGKWYAPELHPNYRPPPPRSDSIPPSQPPSYAAQGQSFDLARWFGSLDLAKVLPGTVVGCGAVIAIGSLLPWANVAFSVLSIGVTGTRTSDGKITLVCGILVLVLGVLMFRGRVADGWLIGGGVLLLVALGLSIHEVSSVTSVAGNDPALQLGGGSYISVTVGAGLWLCLIASVIGLAAIIFAFVSSRMLSSGRK